MKATHIIIALLSAVLIGALTLTFFVLSNVHATCHGVWTINQDPLSQSAADMMPNAAPKYKHQLEIVTP